MDGGWLENEAQDHVLDLLTALGFAGVTSTSTLHKWRANLRLPRGVGVPRKPDRVLSGQLSDDYATHYLEWWWLWREQKPKQQSAQDLKAAAAKVVAPLLGPELLRLCY